MNYESTLLYFVVCFFYGIFSNAQPGPILMNLNDGIGDIVIIDSTTNLTRVALLKNHKNLSLNIRLSKIPVEFKDFVHTESLTITPPTDIEKLDVYFPNLKHLNIRRAKQKFITKKKFKLDSLQTLYIMDAENLENIDGFLNCTALEKLIIYRTPNLIQFSKFRKKNRIKELVIDDGTTYRKKDTVKYLKEIGRLSKLEKLTLGNIYSITEIPSYLPTSIQYLEVNSWAVYNRKTKLKSLKHLKKYINLKTLKLYNLELDTVKEKFTEITLEKLYLNRVHNLIDVSWIFTFAAIDYIMLYGCNEISIVHPRSNTSSISKIDIRNLSNVTSIDALFNLNNLKSLEVRYCPKLILPSTDIMYKTPHIMITGTGYHLFKENGVWEKIEYY